MKKLQVEKVIDYRGHGIIIWNNYSGIRYFAIGTREFKTFKEAKRAIDRWHDRENLTS